MQASEKIMQLILAFQDCGPSEIDSCFSSIVDQYPHLSTEDKKESAQALHSWAVENKTAQLLKYPYSKFLLMVYGFFTEDYQGALSAGVEAQKQFEEQNNHDGIAICSVLKGGIFRTLGNFEIALQYLWEGCEQLGKSGKYMHYQLAGLFQIAGIYSELKNFEESIQLFQKLHDLSVSQNNSNWICNALQGLGRMYLIKKNTLKPSKRLTKR